MNLDQLRKLIAGDSLDKLRDKIKELDDLDRQIEGLTKQRQEINRDLQQMMGEIEPTRQSRAPRQSSGSRRSGVRESVLEAVRKTPGMSPSEIRKALGVIEGDKSGSQSVSNALSALKKAGQIRETEPRKYAVA